MGSTGQAGGPPLLPANAMYVAPTSLPLVWSRLRSTTSSLAWPSALMSGALRRRAVSVVWGWRCSCLTAQTLSCLGVVSNCTLLGNPRLPAPAETAVQATHMHPLPPLSRVTADVKPGQGMYYSVVSHSYMAVNCDSNSHGVAGITIGLAVNPCRKCPANMQTSLDLPASAAHWASDGAGNQGFISQLACVTVAGHGYNGMGTSKCPAG